MRPVAALLAVSCLLLAACGGAGDNSAESAGTPGGGKTLEELWRAPGDDVAVIPGTDHYAPGDVRVSFLVVDAKGRPIYVPTARVWLARELGAKPFLESTARLERIGVPGGDEADATHIYVVHFRVAESGKYWLLAEPKGGTEKVQALGDVRVLDEDPVPRVGVLVPASKTPTLATVRGVASKVTTRVPPDEILLHHSVAESLQAGIPFVVTFATPKFCVSRTCGPVVDVVEKTARIFAGKRVRFIHVEVYEDNDPARGYNRWMREWGLRTEPWTFVVDRRGRVSARFQGPVSVEELASAARAVVAA